MKKRKMNLSQWVVFLILMVVAALFVIPVVLVFMNSLKSNLSISVSMFSLPNKTSFVGLSNYIKGFTFGSYNFWLAFFIVLLLLYLV